MEQNNQKITCIYDIHSFIFMACIGLPTDTLSLSSKYDLFDYWLTYVNNK